MFDAWKQRQRQRLENRPERTVFYNIFATMMLALAAELLYRWGIAAGDGGRRAALTVVCGDVREDTEGPAIYLTEDCGARQTPVWTSPRAAARAVPVTEPLAAVLTAAGKWQISDIHITDLLDIRTESHYNAP